MKKLIILFVFIAFNSNAASMKMIGSKGDPKDVTRVIEVKCMTITMNQNQLK